MEAMNKIAEWRFPLGEKTATLLIEGERELPVTKEDMDALSEFALTFKKYRPFDYWINHDYQI